ncbi:hypothetical protein QF002_000985 [Paraburkholderia youngii]
MVFVDCAGKRYFLLPWFPPAQFSPASPRNDSRSRSGSSGAPLRLAGKATGHTTLSANVTLFLERRGNILVAILCF